ncbi:MAG: hypothetical protein KJP04_00410, partial [Arenicella sp.]|nr:hypothetical protein [Arenicella sp.]
MNIIGINAFHGDSSACIVIDGKLRAAVEEERFRRIKHWAGFPSESIACCLKSQGLRLEDIDIIALNTDPSAARLKKFAFVMSGQASIALIKEKIGARRKKRKLTDYLLEAFPTQVFNGRIEHVEHHLAHLASTYCVSPYKEASILSVDGFGDFASAAWGFGSGGEIDVQKRTYFPHSLGIFYQAMTQVLGFPNYGDEYKVMGLASYGEPKYRDQMDQLLHVLDDGDFRLDLSYFRHHREPIGYQWDNGAPQCSPLFSQKLVDLVGGIRAPEQELKQQHRDLARSVQDAYERALFGILGRMYERHKCDQLTLAGGCAMNSVANGKIHLNTPYKKVYVQAAAGDAGGAIGAAVIANQRSGGTNSSLLMSHAYLGNSFSDSELSDVLAQSADELASNAYQVTYDLPLSELVELVSDQLIAGCVIGWFQGAMEWGPRALGNRSILGDPRRADMKEILNLKIKRRESFRPFAPSVLREHVSDWFESDQDVPFMMKVLQIKKSKRSEIPAVTHIDGSGRLQTVTRESNVPYYELISRFY